MPATRVRHTGIVVSDMDTSLGFYRDLIGMKVSVDSIAESDFVQRLVDVPGAKIRLVQLDAEDGTQVELLQYLSHPGEPDPIPAYKIGCNHVAIDVVDLDGLYEKMKAAGIRFHVPPSGDKVRMTYCRDPEGVIVELVELLE